MAAIIARGNAGLVLAWGATGAAAIGLAWIATQAESASAAWLVVSVGLASAVASWISASSMRPPAHRTFGAAAGAGMFASLVLIGLVSFGLALVPATLLWLATLRAVPKPPEAARWIRSGLVVGSGTATVVVLLAQIG